MLDMAILMLPIGMIMSRLIICGCVASSHFCMVHICISFHSTGR